MPVKPPTREQIQRAKHMAKRGVNRFPPRKKAAAKPARRGPAVIGGKRTNAPKRRGPAVIGRRSGPKLPRVSRPGSSLSRVIKDTSAAIRRQYRQRMRRR